jgi:hypothetical protein
MKETPIKTEPKLHPDLRPHLLGAMMFALSITDQANGPKMRHLARVLKQTEKALTKAKSEPEILLVKSVATCVKLWIDDLKLASESASTICKELGSMAK